MKILFWLSLVGIAYTYIGYPVLIWLIARLWPRPWNKAQISPSVSIVLAVHNGASLLDEKIEQLLSLDYPNVKEIVVVSDGSTDGTAEMLAAMYHPLLKRIFLDEHGGKAVALNAGITRSTSDILVFVDIRPEIAPGSIQTLVNNFADPTVGCVAGELVLRQEGAEATTRAVAGLYWRYEQWIRKCESAVDSPVGVYGGFYAIRRELAQPLPEGTILDDMFQPLSIVRQGYRSVLDQNAIVYDAWPKKAGAEFHRKVRTLAGNFQLFRIAPWMLTSRNRVLFQLVSHKVMRLVVPYLFLTLLASALLLAPASHLFALFALVQILGLGLALAGLFARIPLIHRFSSPAAALLMLNTAAVVGLYKFLFTRGPLSKIWKSGTVTRSVARQENLAPSIAADQVPKPPTRVSVDGPEAVHASLKAPRT
ncbi:MAG TPA: glycosyltransferase family 2 protein [Terracidiphilus sp.]|nr:glycosyltransferase family 2 protein [Terracidiphilus sp.]